MRNLTFSILASAAALAMSSLAATPAQAQITVCDGAGCVQPESNVLFNDATTGTSIISGLNNSDAMVRFNGDGTEVLMPIASGQARITGTDEALNFLEILLDPNGTFTEIEFNLNANADGFATLLFFGVGDVLLNPLAADSVFEINDGGQNFFAGFDATISRVTISTTSELSDVRQIRIGGLNAVTAVPEPATWAMMLLGFGGMGLAMRRRRQSGAQLAQLA